MNEVIFLMDNQNITASFLYDLKQHFGSICHHNEKSLNNCINVFENLERHLLTQLSQSQYPGGKWETPASLKDHNYYRCCDLLIAMMIGWSSLSVANQHIIDELLDRIYQQSSIASSIRMAYIFGGCLGREDRITLDRKKRETRERWVSESYGGKSDPTDPTRVGKGLAVDGNDDRILLTLCCLIFWFVQENDKYTYLASLLTKSKSIAEDISDIHIKYSNMETTSQAHQAITHLFGLVSAGINGRSMSPTILTDFVSFVDEAKEIEAQKPLPATAPEAAHQAPDDSPDSYANAHME
jgi:hypothetical protein